MGQEVTRVLYKFCLINLWSLYANCSLSKQKVFKLKTSNWTGLIYSIITPGDGSLCTCCFKRFISAALGSRLTIGLFLILRALSAYRSVLMVSSMFESAGLTQAIIKVWLLPPKESDETNIESSQKSCSRSFFSHSLCWIIEYWLVLMHFNQYCCYFCVKQQFYQKSSTTMFILFVIEQMHAWKLSIPPSKQDAFHMLCNHDLLVFEGPWSEDCIRASNNDH